MARTSVLVDLLIVLVCVLQVHSSLVSKFSATSAEGSWLWGWVWGAESTVSVVDRSPPLTFHSRPATFGPPLEDPLLGYVIPLSSFTTRCPKNDTSANTEHPNSGCPVLCPSGDHHPDPTESWIALVQRGQCPFVDKIREAQRLGAKAVVVGGEDPDISGLPDTLINMYSKGDASDVTITSTYIRYADYNELIHLIHSSTTSHGGLKTLSLLITTEYSAWEWYSPILTFIIILFLPSCLTFITLLIHRVRLARAAQRDRAPEQLVKSFPWRVWNGTAWEKHEGSLPQPPLSFSVVDLESGGSQSSSSHEAVGDSLPWYESQEECIICLSEFAKGDRVRELPCHHIFHLDEIDNWLINRKKLCPVCKADVTQPWSKSPSAPLADVAMDTDEVDDPPTLPTERTPLLASRDQNVVS